MSRRQNAKETAAVAIHNTGWALGRSVGARIAATVSDLVLGGHFEQCDNGCDQCISDNKPTQQN
ncbi:hypothetical protein [Streptomyces sp. NPDC096030]|uniref:hypothetical protein n=1 Tax=Streptomyces sp. NPDC096030 TaxID=3155423 RepID=UPI00331FE92C